MTYATIVRKGLFGSILWTICHATWSLPIVDWVLEHPGSQFDLVRQRIQDRTEENGLPGVFAKAPIAEGEILATIPWSAIVTPTSKGETPTDHLATFSCGLARKMGDEVGRGSPSPYAPYFQHLKQWYSNKNKLPSQYSDNGKLLWTEILGGEESKWILEKPAHYVFWDWNIFCGAQTQADTDNNGNDQLQEEERIQAAMWVQQHAFQDLMIPLKDLYTHRNGNYHNVQVRVVDRVHAQIVARRDIQPGEQLHTSYTDCESCQKDDENDNQYYGTPGR